MARKKKKVELRKKVRESLGKGLDVYFGPEPGPRADEAETAAATPPETRAAPAAPSRAAPVSPEPPPADEDAVLDRYLQAEVLAAGDALAETAARPAEEAPPAKAPEGEGAPAAVVTSPRPPTARELAESTVGGRVIPFTPPSPAPEAAPPTPEPAPVPARPPVREPAPAVTPTPAGPAPMPTPPPVDVTPPRVRIGGILPETPMEVEVAPPGPREEPGIPPPPPPAGPLRREDILQRVDPQRFSALLQEIDDLYQEVPTVLASKKNLADEVLLTLREARDILWRSPERIVDAEYRVQQARTVMLRYQLSAKWGNTQGLRIFVYEVAWLTVLVGIFFFALVSQSGIVQRVSAWTGTDPSAPHLLLVVPFLINMVWGGIGGVVGALYSLWWHVSEVQDFDRQYTMWYLVQPIMGVVLGGIVYLVVNTGFLALQGQAITTESNVAMQLFPALVATLGGFRQTFVYELLERIIRVLTPRPEE